jgi:hypothetical protein
MPKMWPGAERGRFLPAASGLALALSGSCCTTDEACQEALALRQPSDPPPRCDPAGRCAQIQQEPRRVVRFVFDLFKTDRSPNEMGFFDSFPLEKKVRNWACVGGMLRPRGVEILPRNDLNDVFAVGTYEQVQDAFEIASVNSIEVDCGSEGLCQECRSKAEPECAADRLCYVHRVGGQPQCAPSGHPQPAAAEVSR